MKNGCVIPVLIFAVMIAQIARGAECIEPVTDMYMIVDLSSNSTCRVSYRDSVPMGGWSSEYKKTKLVLRKIPEGTFKMGGYIRNEVGLSEKDAPFFCGEVRDVKISRPYYLGVFEVTQRQYEMVTGTNPSVWVSEMHPVNCVSWVDVRGEDSTAPQGVCGPSVVGDCSFLGRLRKITGLDGFDLPTEAQWECACKGGTDEDVSESGLASGGPSALLVARCWENGGAFWPTNCVVADVGSYAPNPYGLYDMHGNVFEWCIDRRAKYDDNVDVDPMNYGDSSQGHVNRVLRGGSGRGDARHCNSSFRWGASARARINEYGFRIAYCIP